MIEYFPERRKSSTDLLPLPKAAFFRRSPSPAKRSFSDLLNPFQKRSNDDSLFFLEKQEPFPKRQAKVFSTSKNKISNNRNGFESMTEILQSYSSKQIANLTDDSYSFINELSIEMPREMSCRQNNDSNSELKNRNEKYFVILELITSEIVYLKQIYFIINTPFPILNELKAQFFPKVDSFSIFGNLHDVFRSNVIFWTDYMEDVFQLLRISGEVPDIRHLISGFCNFSKHFVPYKTYCMNISSNCEYIAKLEMESDNFRQFLEWCRNSDSSNRLGLDTFITMPFQRLTRYLLFLERILKECTDKDEIQNVLLAISEVDKFVNNINKCVKVKDLTSKLRYFQSILIGFHSVEDFMKGKFLIPPYPAFNLLCPMQVKPEFESEVRCLLHQDTLRLKQIHKKTMSIKVLLFTDLLMFAKPIKKHQQCYLQLLDHPITLDQLVIYDSPSLAENEECFFLAEINNFNCFSNIYKLFNDKASNCKTSLKIFQKKITFAKVHYGAIMLQSNKTNVHINVTNSDDINLNKEEEIYPPENPLSQFSGSSSISDNDSDCEYLEFANKSLSSSSWTDLENNLNSCIISDPFINYFDLIQQNDGITPRNSYRPSLLNTIDKFGKRKHDSVQSFGGESSFVKLDCSPNILRRSSLGNKHIVEDNINN